MYSAIHWINQLNVMISSLIYFKSNYIFQFISSSAGYCIDEVNKFRCICNRGYVGRTCDIDYDDCGVSPCAHGRSLSPVDYNKVI